MMTEIEGHGRQQGVEQEFRGKKYKTGLLTKARSRSWQTTRTWTG